MSMQMPAMGMGMPMMPGMGGMPPGGAAAANPNSDQAIIQALDAAFGANPATRQVAPGPIAHLLDRLHGQLAQGGHMGSSAMLPTGTMRPTPPAPPASAMMPGMGMPPGGAAPAAVPNLGMMPGAGLNLMG